MKLLAIDGNSIMNRAFYGIKLLSNSKGQFTNALTGFMNIYLKEIGEVKPDCVAVAFDLKAPTFRHKANAAYKANRKGMPEELAQQMPVIKELLGDLGIKIVQCEGYEADDILGTLAKKGEEKGYFEFGGSTVVLILKKDTVKIDDDIINNSSKNIETRVLLGQTIGHKGV